MSVCCLLLMLVVAAAVTAAERHAGHCVPSCEQLLPQMAGALHWCSTRPFSDKAIVDTVVDCVFPDAPGKISATAPANVNNKMVVASSFTYEDIARSDTKWTECKAERLEDGSEVSFGAVWNASEGFCPGRYAIWLATYDVQSCWFSDELSLSEIVIDGSDYTMDQKKAASLPKAKIYLCKRCSSVKTENSTEGSKVSAGEIHTYFITNNGSPMVFRYLSCDESKAQTFPVLEAVNVKEFTCEECHQWFELDLKNIYNCQAGKIGQDEFRDKSICEEDRLPPTMWPPTKETTVQTTTTMQPTTTTMQPTTTTMQPTTTTMQQTTATVQPTTTTMQPATTTMQQTTATMQPKTVTMQQTTTTMQQTTITVQPTTNTVHPTTTAMQPTTTTTQPTTTTTLPTTTTTQPTTTTMQPTTTTMQQTTTTMSMERATSLMGKQTPHFTTQPPSSSGSNYVEPNANDQNLTPTKGTPLALSIGYDLTGTEGVHEDSSDVPELALASTSERAIETETNRQETSTEGNIKVPERVQEALKQLDTQNFKDDPLKNRSNIPDPDQMLKNLDAVINFANNLKKEKVLRSLEGFEMFTKTVLLPVANSKEQPVTVKYGHSTLVVAAGIIGAAVSDDGEKVDLLRYGQEEYSEEALLELSASAGVMLPVKGNESATAIAVTVLRHELLNASFTQQGLHLNSDVVSVQVETSNSSPPTDYVDIFLKPRIHGVRRRCGIWDFAYNAWNFDYCTLYRLGQVIDLCRCWHLTHFAQLVTDDDVKWGSHAKPLEVLTLAGVFTSLLGVIGLGAAAVLDRKWRRKPGTRLLLQLGSAVAARDFLMVLVTLDAFRPSWLWRLQGPDACPLLGVALHYALLASAAWTTAAAVQQLLRLSTVVGYQAVVPHAVLVFSVCSWLLPLVPVVMTVATLGLKGGYPLREDSTTDFLCYPKGIYLYATVVFPVALCTAINAAIFLYLVMSVLFPICLRGTVMEIRRHGPVNLRRRVMMAVVLFFHLGLPWLLGPPARAPVVAYLFCAIATTQGMMLFVFFVVCNGPLRKSICASVSRVVFFTSTCSVGAGYSRSSHNTANARVSDSSSDSAPARNRRKIRRQEELELTQNEGEL